MYAVGITGTGRSYPELHNGLLGRRFPVGSLHQNTFPTVDDTFLLHGCIAVVGKNLNLTCQLLIDILRTIGRVTHNTGTYPLGSIAGYQCVAEILVEFHLQKVRGVSVVITLVISLVLFLVLSPAAQPFGSTYQHTADNHRNDVPFRTALIIGLVVLLVVQTVIAIERQLQIDMCLGDIAA